MSSRLITKIDDPALVRQAILRYLADPSHQGPREKIAHTLATSSADPGLYINENDVRLVRNASTKEFRTLSAEQFELRNRILKQAENNMKVN